MKTLKGQSIQEYIIIIGVIAITVIAMLMLFGNNVHSIFFSNNNELTKVTNVELTSSENNLMDYFIDETESDIESKESDIESTTNTGNTGLELKDLKLGSLILKDVPVDFNSYIQSTGSSGMTDKIADIISQIADQIAIQGNIINAEKLQVLANKAYNIARIEEGLANTLGACGDDTDCIESYRNEPFPEISNFIEDPNNDMLFNETWTYKDRVDELVYIRNYTDKEIIKWPNDVGVAFWMTALEIQDSPNLDSSTKAVIDKLSSDVARISETTYDGIYNHSVPKKIPEEEKIMLDEASYLTDYDAKLICYHSTASPSSAKVCE